MKYLPIITMALWIAMVAFYYCAKTLFFNPYILLPLFTLLSIFIPMSFWVMQFTGKRFLSVIFIGLFLANCFILGFQLVRSAVNVSKIEPYEVLVIDPAQANQRFTAEKGVQRLNISRYIYERSGLATSYKNDDGRLQVFSPNDLEKSTMYLNASKHYQMLENKGHLMYYIQGIALLLAIHIIIFVGTLVYLVLLEGPGTKRKLTPAY